MRSDIAATEYIDNRIGSINKHRTGSRKQHRLRRDKLLPLRTPRSVPVHSHGEARKAFHGGDRRLTRRRRRRRRRRQRRRRRSDLARHRDDPVRSGDDPRVSDLSQRSGLQVLEVRLAPARRRRSVTRASPPIHGSNLVRTEKRETRASQRNRERERDILLREKARV